MKTSTKKGEHSCQIVPSCPYNEKRELNEEADITLTQSHLKFGG